MYCKCGCGFLLSKISPSGFAQGHHMRLRKLQSNQYIDNNNGSTKLIVANGVEFLIDTDDVDKAQQYCWYEYINHCGLSYAQANIIAEKKTTTKLHRVIMNFPNDQIDHIDRDTHNNRKANLRVASNGQNQANSKQRKTKHLDLIYKGVSYSKNHEKYMAHVRINNKLIHLGTFDTEEEAAKAYDKAAYAAWGEYALLNFTNPQKEIYG